MNILVAQRRSRGINQQAIADQIGVTQRQVSRMEAGKNKKILREKSQLIAKAYGVSEKEIEALYATLPPRASRIDSLPTTLDSINAEPYLIEILKTAAEGSELTFRELRLVMIFLSRCEIPSPELACAYLTTMRHRASTKSSVPN